MLYDEMIDALLRLGCDDENWERGWCSCKTGGLEADISRCIFLAMSQIALLRPDLDPAGSKAEAMAEHWRKVLKRA